MSSSIAAGIAAIWRASRAYLDGETQPIDQHEHAAVHLSTAQCCLRWPLSAVKHPTTHTQEAKK